MKRKIYKLLSSAKQGLFTLALTALLGTAYSQTTFTFNYTGNVQTINLQGGAHIIEMWGADGGDNLAPSTGGKGGYATGTLNVVNPGTYYIYVGGRGITGLGGQPSAPGGFNGGGDAAAYTSSGYGMGSGGGASHIATAPGLLSTLSGNQAAVVIVAGGGGGSGSNHGGSTLSDLGGNGGGLIGGNGLTGTYGGTGGTQTTGGTGSIQNGSFGRGGSNSGSNTGGGGGGGWYGGGAAQWEGSGGGSSYLGGVTNGTTAGVGQAGFIVNPDVTGNGYIKITQLCNLGLQATKNPICFGETINLTTTASNVSWSHTTSTATLVNVSPTSNTSYTVSGQAVTGCTTSAIVNVTVNPLPSLSANITPSVLCIGKTATITASGANSYTWANSSVVAPTTTVDPVVTTSYNYSGTNQFGCVNTAAANVVVNTNVIGVTSNTSICAGKSIDLDASGAETYTWSTGSFFKSTPVSPSSNTTYTVSGTDIHNCVISNMVSVNVNPLPNVSISADKNFVCMGESVSLTASGANTYVWNTGGTTAQINATLPLDITYYYTVTGTDNNGCSKSAVVSVISSECTGIQEKNANALITRVYPNPVKDQLTVETSNSDVNTIEVTDVTGRVIFTTTSKSAVTTVDMNSFSSGIYYVRVKTNSAADVIKVVKQ